MFFFDTPDLTLNEAGSSCAPAGSRASGDDTVVKLRPVVPDELPDELRKSPSFGVEVDAMPGGYVCSASFKGGLAHDRRAGPVLGGKPLRKLFSKEQRAFFAAHAPEGIEIDDLSVLGPIFVLKLKFAPEGFARQLVAEMWLYPDGSRLLELSTKCLPAEASQVAAETSGFLAEPGHRSRGRAADEDEDGARVLLEEIAAATK